MAGINLVAREMCDECDAFLGKQHTDKCSKSGEVTFAQATEKFTTLEHAEAEDPLVGLDVPTVELILRSMIPPEVAEDDAEQLVALRGGLETFVAGVREVEGEDPSGSKPLSAKAKADNATSLAHRRSEARVEAIKRLHDLSGDADEALPLARVIQQAYYRAGQLRDEGMAQEVRDAVEVLVG